VEGRPLFDRFADVVDPPANEFGLGVVVRVNSPRPGERSLAATRVALYSRAELEVALSVSTVWYSRSSSYCVVDCKGTKPGTSMMP
jgi:hypothetical protein